MSVASDFLLLAWNGIDGQTFQTYNAALTTDTIGIWDRNFGTQVNPNQFRVVLSVSAGHIVQVVRPYNTTGAVQIPLGGYALTANGTALPYLSHYAAGDILQVLATSSCDPRTEGVPIATYHALGDTPDAFEGHLQAIQALGYNTVSVDQLGDYLGFPSVPLPSNPILLTFDDGLDDQISWAPELLHTYGMVGTFFIITSYPGTLAAQQWASWSEINAALAMYPDNVVLACHSHAAHLQVNGVGKYLTAGFDAAADLALCRSTLLAQTGVDTHAIAWPFGDYSEGLVNLATDAGFDVMLGTFPGLNHPDNDGALSHVRRFGGDPTQAWSVEEAEIDRWRVCP